ncbi:hypothetical protein E3E22_00575 [Thermococcus sp. MV5]|uniref:hypothetical protein n=1 Tax=Thermococcus sp. MV5 TaxID=1638272 RepID=UPI00143C4494|nr:hypothetical protein [Thermococcus sp. MV5]NJE25146.1 hypothetical protein [Thermococcus sp. MV5]
MKKKEKLLIFLFLSFLIFYLSPKGLVVELKDALNHGFESYNTSLKQCPFEIKANYYQYRLAHYVNFTILGGNVILANSTLEGVTGEYLCLSDGILLYAYYPGDPAGDTSMVFLSYNFSEEWRKKFRGLVLPEYYESGSLLLVKHGSFEQGIESCVYVINVTAGDLTFKFCPEVPRGFSISHVKILKDRYYFVVVYVETKFLWVRTNGELYLVEESKVRKARVASIGGSALGAGFWVDANNKYVAVAYFLANEEGNRRNGLCVFTSRHLIKVACKSFDKKPRRIKLKDNMIYVQFRDGSVKTYKIIAP